jgi:hypothetical protein
VTEEPIAVWWDDLDPTFEFREFGDRMELWEEMWSDSTERFLVATYRKVPAS